jgi:RIO-like serine/threonine protein kinase
MQVHREKADHMALALGDAYNAGILHRDFSPGNVIILGDSSGQLIDWDLSKPVKLWKATPRCAT